MWSVSALANKNLVIHSDASLWNKVHSSKRSRTAPDVAMGQNTEAPNGDEAQTDFRQFVYELL